MISNQNATFSGIVTSTSSHVGGATTFGEDLTGNVTGNVTLDGKIILHLVILMLVQTTLITPTQFNCFLRDGYLVTNGPYVPAGTD